VGTFSLEEGYHKYWGQTFFDELTAILSATAAVNIPGRITVESAKSISAFEAGRHRLFRRAGSKLLEDSFPSSTPPL